MLGGTAASQIQWRVSQGTPSVEPVSATEAKLWLKIDGTDEDNLIAIIIPAARSAIEAYCGICLVNRAVTITTDQSPDDVALDMPVRPISAITSVKTYDSDRTATTFAATNYFLDNSARRPRIALKADASWPTNEQPAGFEVVVTAGFGAAGANVPADLRTACLALTAWMYANRGDDKAVDIPPQVRTVLDRHRSIGVR